MFTNLNLTAPDFLIKCATLTHSNQVYVEMRNNNIRRSYAYAIAIDDPNNKFQYQIIKIGRSSPNPGDNEVQVGERIARQLAHLNGWQYFTGYNPISSHGQDFLNAVQRAIEDKLLPYNFNKDYVTVGIWDITARMNDVLQNAVTTEFMATCYAEAELTNQFKIKNNGDLPICNFVDPAKQKVYKGYIPKSVGQMFGWS